MKMNVSVDRTMLQTIQTRMLRRKRSGGSRWTDREFAELAVLYLKYWRRSRRDESRTKV
jgi:hypothetical protein